MVTPGYRYGQRLSRWKVTAETNFAETRADARMAQAGRPLGSSSGWDDLVFRPTRAHWRWKCPNIIAYSASIWAPNQLVGILLLFNSAAGGYGFGRSNAFVKMALVAKSRCLC